MKRHTPAEAIAGFFCIVVMFLATTADTWQNAKKGAWGYFWLSFAGALFMAAILGFLAIDSFNEMQRRRRARKKLRN